MELELKNLLIKRNIQVILKKINGMDQEFFMTPKKVNTMAISKMVCLMVLEPILGMMDYYM